MYGGRRLLMKGSARMIAICGVCGAISCVALLLTSVVPYVALIFGVMAAVATVVPLLIDGKNLGYSLLIYAVTLTIGALCGIFIGQIVAVAPVALFCIPFAIVKVWCESVKVTARVENTETLDDPFGGESDAKVVHVEFNGKPRVNPVVKWVLYYVLTELGVGLTFLFTWLITPAVFQQIYSNKIVFWLIVGAAQLVPPLYDLLLRGCLVAAAKIVRKSFK